MSSKRRKESEAAAADSIQISPSKQLAAGSRVGKRTGAPTHTTTQISLKNVSNISNNISNLELSSTSVGQVFVVGSGDCAQLGLGPDVFEKERPAKIAYFDDLEICKVVAGGLHTLALSLEGKLYSWGCNDQKALGRSGEETEPAPVENLDSVFIVDMACGDSCSVALSRQGLVYAWGTFRGTNGIFGFAPGIETQPVPYLIPDFKGITQISAGTNHILAMAKDGKIYSWGIGEQNQLGRKIMTRNALGASLLPRPINFRPYRKTNKFTAVWCGGYHSVLVHESNALFSFGLNNYGQLGLDDLEEHDSPLQMEGIDEKNGIVEVGGGEHYSLVLDSLGQVWVCGRNDSGQLGLDPTLFPEHSATPIKIPDLPAIKSISCGAAFSLAVTHTGDLWAWGYGEMGQLANESSDAPVPFQIDLKGRHVIMATGGGQHTVMLIAPKQVE